MLAHATVSQPTTKILPFQSFDRPAPDLRFLFVNQAAEKFACGTAIFWEGDPAAYVFELTEGVLRVFKMLSDGRRTITGFLYPGDLIGLSFRERYLYSVEAVTPVRIRRFTRTRFQQEIAASPALRPLLLARLCDEMAAAQDQMVLLARKSAEERVCSFLLLVARRAGIRSKPQPVIDLPMTRLDMADYLGLTIETVSRIMSRLKDRGVIAPGGRHKVVFRDPAGLARLAGHSEGDDDRPYALSEGLRQDGTVD